MSEIAEKAARARALRDSPALQELVADIRDEAVTQFLNPHSSVEAREAAHVRVRAVQFLLDAIQARLDAEKFEQKKDQHRVND